MSFYDKQCSREFTELETSIKKYFVEMTVECPYALPHDAVFYQALFAPLGDRTMELFLASGYRRNGNCLYTMHCPHCQECIPIRLHPGEMTYNRNQRRTLKKNSDLVIEFGEPSMSQENIELCDRFLQSRYPQKSNRANSYYSGFFINSITTTMEIRYRLGERLVGNGIIDVGENWMNAVYFYFDPDEAGRSLGTFNILTMIDLCLKHNIEYLYLGYFIEEVAAMNYKRYFQPYYLRLDSHWQRCSSARRLS
ncbi:MAG: arginyltransferase [Thermodesulfobacteriota bacterium]